MLRKFVFILLIGFSFLWAEDFEYPTLINPDGTIQRREFSKEQKTTFDSIQKDVKYFHTELSKILPYLIREGKVKEKSYTREIRNFTETPPGRTNSHFVSENFVIKLTNDGKVENISFLKRRSRLNPKMYSETVIRTISNDISNEEMTALKVQIDTYTNYTDPSAPIRKLVSMSEIPSPLDRIRLLRTYRAKLEEAVREIDKLIDHKVLNDHIKLSNTLNDIELE
ncbi:MAG TPA: hypothetical protein PK079_02155 [Leptospiraceae bacterium]|nr:hypothetical protein [Leptospiraceae bacterium]HMX35465.1 hypothetical protein [Leptospiraceae bacterium]HMY29560.1 hypothetical protein [Leptospiraceae bacterium]HMZ67192.1 hypothetical protein [Leptospiraceae bacterium]HNA06001.1 hypothetical protein [Leptospiraceae bacterium]